MELSAQIIKEMSVIVDDNNAMTKLLKYVKRLVRDTSDRNKVDNLTYRIGESLREVKESKEGKRTLNTLDSLLDELEN